MTKKNKKESLQPNLKQVNKEIKLVNKELDKTEKKFESIHDKVNGLIEGNSELAKKFKSNYEALNDKKRNEHGLKVGKSAFGFIQGAATGNVPKAAKSAMQYGYHQMNGPDLTSSNTNRQKGSTDELYDLSRKQEMSKRGKTEMLYDSGKSHIKLMEGSIKYNNDKGNIDEVRKKDKELTEKRIKMSEEILKLNEEEIFHLENGLPEMIEEVDKALYRIRKDLDTGKQGGLVRGHYGLGKDAEPLLSTTTNREEIEALEVKYTVLSDYLTNMKESAENAKKYSDDILMVTTLNLEKQEENKKKHVNTIKSTNEEEIESEEERFDRLEELQIRAENDAQFKDSLQQRVAEGVKAREAIKIEEIDKEKLFASEREKITKDAEQTESNSFNERLEQHEEYNEDTDELQQQNSEAQQEIVEQTNDEVADSEANSQKTRLEQWKDYAEKAAEISRKISEATSMVTSSLGGMFGQLGSYYADQVQAFADKIAVLDEEKEAALERVALSEEERQAKEEEIAIQKIELEYATSDEQRAKADERIATLQDELSAEDTINREFGDKKAELEKEKAKKEAEQKKAENMEKRLQMSQAIVEAIGNVAAGVVKAWEFGPILGPILAPIVGVAGGIQVGIMSKQLTKMKNGGLLRGLSHSQGGMPILGSSVEVEGGEYVVNKQSTSKNLGLLEYINGERRGLGYMDMSTYFGEQSVPPSFLTQMMNEPSVVPQLPMSESVDTNRILSAIDSINFQPRVSVTDINTVHESMVKVDEWTGM